MMSKIVGDFLFSHPILGKIHPLIFTAYFKFK